MKVIVKKSIDMGRSDINITTMYLSELEKSHQEGSVYYKNCRDAFHDLLQDLVDEAFRLGQSE